MSESKPETEVVTSGSRTTLNAGVWIVSGKLASRLIDFVTLAILARLLDPADFGLVAMAASLLLIVEAVTDLPLAQALIRVPELNPRMYATSLTLGLLRGMIVAVAMIALSVPAAYFYDDGRLTALICLLSIAPVCRGLMSPRMVDFARQLDFRRDVAIDAIGKCVAFVMAVLVAVWTKSYFAIAVGTISYPLTSMVLSYVVSPMRWRLTLAEWSHFRELVGWNSVTASLQALNWQTDRVLLGHTADAQVLGRYSLADTLVAIPYQIFIQAMARPVFVSMAQARSEHRLDQVFTTTACTTLILVAPLYLFMALSAADIVPLVLGAKWVAIAPIFRDLALVAIIGLPFSHLNGLLMVSGHTRKTSFIAGFELLTRIPITFITIRYLGLEGAVLARLLSAVVMFAYNCRLYRVTFGWSLAHYLRDIVLSLSPALLAAAVTLCAMISWDHSGLPSMIGVGHLVLASLVYFVPYLFALFLISVSHNRFLVVQKPIAGRMIEVVSRVASYPRRLRPFNRKNS